MPRSCGAVQNYFRQVDFYPDLRRNQAVLEGMTRAAALQGGQVERQLPPVIPGSASPWPTPTRQARRPAGSPAGARPCRRSGSTTG